MIKPESVQQLKEKIDLVEVIREYLPNLRQRGKNYFAHCPFHSERTPSFSVSPEKKIIHCFGCGYSADIIKFVQDIEHISYTESVEKLAKKYNFKLEYSLLDKEKFDERKAVFTLLNTVAEIYHEILLTEEIAAHARKYLALRGINIDTIKKFKLGYAPDKNFIVCNYKTLSKFKELEGKIPIDLSMLHKAGIINFFLAENEKNELKKYDHPYDYFRDRIIFPVFDLSGRVITFGGRILPETVSAIKETIPVYINGPETIVFNKGANLYGLFQAKEAIVKQKSAIVVEGYMDVLILHQEGINNVVAPLGTALTDTQVKLLSRFCNCITILFDSDTAGQSASIAAAETVYRNNLYPQIVTLPQNVDPDEFVLNQGPQKLLELLNRPISPIKVAIKYYLSSLGKTSLTEITTKEKIEILKNLLELTSSISNPVAKSDAIKEIAQELNINEEIIRTELKKKQKGSYLLEQEKFLNSRPYSCEEELLWICIHYPQKIPEIPEVVFDHNHEYLEIFRSLKNIYYVTGDIYQLIEMLPQAYKDLIIRIVYDDRKNINQKTIETKLAKLYEDINKIKLQKKLKQLQTVVADMLSGKIAFDIKTVNEFKQTAELLKRK